MKNEANKTRMESWKYQSPDAPGFHKVIVPGEADCKVAYMFRLNLLAGESYLLETGELEENVVLLSGRAKLSGHPILNQDMIRFGSFYLPGKASVSITAKENCVFYIAGAKCEGIGEAFYRVFDENTPLGDVHQIHGQGVGKREVMFTLNHQIPASRLICGLTWGGTGAWTSWPPHQHEKDLEEIYCYFNMPAPQFGLHLSYLKSGETEDVVAHAVQSGSMVLAPCGYHPTVASPSTRNAYFWALAAFEPSSRRYDLAVEDPALTQYKG